MEILKYDDYVKCEDNAKISGVVWIKNYAEKAGNKPYIDGSILVEGEKISFKVWSSSPIFASLKNNDFSESPLFIDGTVSKQYNNINITNIAHADTLVFTKDKFKKQSPYDLALLERDFLELLKKNLTDKGYALIDTLMEISSKGEVYEKFVSNYAASSHHDNCPGGLLAHTFKCLSILETFAKLYGWMGEDVNMSNDDFKDLMYIGIAIHDIGKIYEINEDVYYEDSFNSHRIIGLEILFANKDRIVSDYSEHFYNLLVSILVGHHGEWGDKPKTFEAILVHHIDYIESVFTEAGQKLVTGVSEEPAGKRINLGGEKYYL